MSTNKILVEAAITNTREVLATFAARYFRARCFTT